MKKIKLLVSVALCATLVAGMLTGCGEPKKQEKVIGIQLYSARDAMRDDVPGTLKAIADIGYKEVELASYGDGKFYNMEPAAFKQEVEAVGMKIISSHIGRGLSRDADKYAEDMAWWNTAIAAHNAAGIQYMVMPSPPIRLNDETTVEDLKAMCDYLNDIGVNCNSAGIRFGYHNHSGEFKALQDGTIPFEYLVANTDPTRVFFQLDVYWAQRGGFDPAELIKKYPDRIQVLHIKDEKEIGASGTMDFKAIYEAAYATGKVKAYIVEQEDYSGPVMESLKASFDYLNNAEFVK